MCNIIEDDLYCMSLSSGYDLQGILSFLSAPLLGALSDAWGRKSFLILSVFFTCAPIPILLINAT